jgi:hypothetical protein
MRRSEPEPGEFKVRPNDIVISADGWAKWGGPGAPMLARPCTEKEREAYGRRMRGQAKDAADFHGEAVAVVAVLGSDDTVGTLLYSAEPGAARSGHKD